MLIHFLRVKEIKENPRLVVEVSHPLLSCYPLIQAVRKKYCFLKERKKIDFN